MSEDHRFKPFNFKPFETDRWFRFRVHDVESLRGQVPEAPPCCPGGFRSSGTRPEGRIQIRGRGGGGRGGGKGGRGRGEKEGGEEKGGGRGEAGEKEGGGREKVLLDFIAGWHPSGRDKRLLKALGISLPLPLEVDWKRLLEGRLMEGRFGPPPEPCALQ